VQFLNIRFPVAAVYGSVLFVLCSFKITSGCSAQKENALSLYSHENVTK
jgi:hypothetical protein